MYITIILIIKGIGVETEAKIIHLEANHLSYTESDLLYDRTPIVNYQINGETFINELPFYYILMRSGNVINIANKYGKEIVDKLKAKS